MTSSKGKRSPASLLKKLSQMQKLAGISITLNSTKDLGALIKFITTSAAEMLDCEAVTLLLYSAGQSSLYFAESSSPDVEKLSEIQVPLQNSLAGLIFLENQPLILNDAGNDPRHFSLAAKHVNFLTRSLMGVPMRFQDRTTGVIEALNKRNNVFTAEDLEILEVIASQAAVAIENARLMHDLQDAYQSTLEGWSGALDLRDKETYGHSRRVADMTVALAREMGVPDELLEPYRQGALLHDIGKMGVPDRILLKNGPLTEDEWQVMRQHPQYAFNLLQPIEYLKNAAEIPYCHHEKWDGTGYPRGLHGEQIPLGARIFAVIDVWDALRSTRPYRAVWSKQAAANHIQDEAGKSFDPHVVAVFMRIHEQPVFEVQP